MKKIFYSALFALFAISCSDLDEGLYNNYVAEDFYADPDAATAPLAGIYNEVRGDFGGKGIAGADRGWYDLNETCTDEMMLPTRSDGAWADNGIWRAMYTHTWTSSQEFIGNTWNWLYRSVSKCNDAIAILNQYNAPKEVIAETKVLRAYFYYMLMDGWGDVPYYTDRNAKFEDIPQISRAAVYDSVLTELEANVDLLSEEVGGAYYGRFNKWAAYALLSKIYINGQEYTGTPKWDEAKTACDVIINSGLFSLEPNLYNSAGSQPVFGDVLSDKEVILSVYIDALLAKRNIIGIRTLAGPHGQALFNFSSWNGATVHQDFVDKYDDLDKRKAQWLIGDQPGNVSYTKNISSLTNAGVEAGARNAKFLPVPPFDGNESTSNDFPVYRYADILLTKAEAELRRTGGDATVAQSLLNQVRNRAGLADFPATITLDEVYDERGRELCWEGHRRQDMIRFGKFTQAHDFKNVSAATYKLFPIPASALNANGTLDQNDGY